MKLIQVTSAKKIEPIYINIDMIGHINSYTETGNYSGEIKGRVVTNIGVTTHNNGGFYVIETVREVIQKIKIANGLIESKVNLAKKIQKLNQSKSKIKSNETF